MPIGHFTSFQIVQFLISLLMEAIGDYRDKYVSCKLKTRDREKEGGKKNITKLLKIPDPKVKQTQNAKVHPGFVDIISRITLIAI